VRDGFDWLFRERTTGRVVIAQLPNLPLALFGICRLAQWITHPDGTTRDVLVWAGSAALVWWALDEIIRGVNPFRRLLGTTVLVVTVIAVV
jgi:hypothetical protein